MIRLIFEEYRVHNLSAIKLCTRFLIGSTPDESVRGPKSCAGVLCYNKGSTRELHPYEAPLHPPLENSVLPPNI
eukprot:4533760-Pyramimonas_sp.AAC.1